jgi:hypothetical protein
MLSIKATGGSTEYDLPVLTGEVAESARDWYERGRCPELVPPCSPSDLFDFACPVAADEPPPAIGQLHWPVVGAARYASGLFVLDGWALGKLRADMAGNPAVTLSFRDAPDDDAETARTFPLFLVAARPFDQTTTAALPTGDDPPAEDDLWVLTLVDRRWFWQANGGSTLAASDPAPASWADLFAALAGALDGAPTLTVTDSVASAYLTPTPRWSGKALAGKPTAWALDAAAHHIGSRIVSLPDGTFALHRPTGTHRTAVTAAHAVYAVTGADPRHTSGGLISSADVTPGVAATANCVFYDDLGGEPYSETASTGGGASGKTVTAWLDVKKSASGGSRTAAAAQWAADWYEWQKQPLDALYDGFVEIPASAFVWSAVLYHDGLVGYTRLCRAPIGHSPLFGYQPPFNTPGCHLETDADGNLAVTPATLAGPGLEEVAGATEEDCTLLGVKLACPLEFDGDDAVSIDLATIAGTGISVVPGVGDACDTLAADLAEISENIDWTLIDWDQFITNIFLANKVGCGLRNKAGAIAVDYEASASDGLIGNNTDCTFQVQPDCGIEVSPTGVAVDFPTVAGIRANSALIVRADAVCDSLGVDLIRDDTKDVAYYVDTIQDLTVAAGGVITLSYKRRLVTHTFNVAGLQINTTLGAAEDRTETANVCDAGCDGGGGGGFGYAPSA